DVRGSGAGRAWVGRQSDRVGDHQAGVAAAALGDGAGGVAGGAALGAVAGGVRTGEASSRVEAGGGGGGATAVGGVVVDVEVGAIVPTGRWGDERAGGQGGEAGR